MSDEVATVDAAALRRALDDAGRSAEEPLDHLLEEMERPELEPAGEEPIEMAGSAAPELEAADAPHVLRAFDYGVYRWPVRRNDEGATRSSDAAGPQSPHS